MLIVYAITVFVSATLLLIVQPMFARMVLPMLGGSPAVWNTALVFYQATLLAGYAYAHASTRWLGVRRQAVLHLILLLLPLLVLPIGIPTDWTPPAEANPIPWLLRLLTVSVGLPFLLVSTSSPMLQRWFSATRHALAGDPYVLYAASNIGSLLAILLYPTVVEPHLTLQAQSWSWAASYGLLIAFTTGCAMFLWKSRAPDANADSKPAPELSSTESETTPLTFKRRGRWLLLSFAPSSLMLSVTTYISSDLAAVPLLWVIPLAIYLLSFILVFARKRFVPDAVWIRSLPIGMVALVMVLAIRATQPIAVLLLLHLAVFFIVAMVCHGAIAKDRPSASHLTEFYLWMSFGGVLGGAFNALIAPLLFTSVSEYPVTLILACFLGVRAAVNAMRPRLVLDLALPVSLGAILLVVLKLAPRLEASFGTTTAALIFGPAVGACFLFSRRPVRFSMGIAIVLLASSFYQSGQSRLLHAERSFFGIHRVTVDAASQYIVLFHGQTIHGMQSLDSKRRREPLTYYHRTGPAGQLFAECSRTSLEPVAVVGLGAGTLACYGQPGQAWTFFEIDPAVARIAKDSRYFTYLRDTSAKVKIVLGDARLTLVRTPDRHFGLMVLDAYSSDAIPVHLITREALRLYLSKLTGQGLLAFHISNLHLDLRPVLSNLARDAGLVCIAQQDVGLSDAEKAEGKRASQWLIMARARADLAGLASDSRWENCQGEAGAVVWTDNFSSILDVLMIRNTAPSPGSTVFGRSKQPAKDFSSARE
jgi:spermidine synthase